MRDVKLTFTTDGSGNATAETNDLGYCKLYAVEWIDGDLVDGVDATFKVTGNTSGVDRTILTLTNANADAFYHVSAAAYGAAGAAITDSHVPVIVDGKIAVTIASGGSAKSGAAILYLG